VQRKSFYQIQFHLEIDKEGVLPSTVIREKVSKGAGRFAGIDRCVERSKSLQGGD